MVMGATSKKLMPRGIIFATLVGWGPTNDGNPIEIDVGVGATDAEAGAVEITD